MRAINLERNNKNKYRYFGFGDERSILWFNSGIHNRHINCQRYKVSVNNNRNIDKNTGKNNEINGSNNKIYN
jgi:hypothetical protein